MCPKRSVMHPEHSVNVQSCNRSIPSAFSEGTLFSKWHVYNKRTEISGYRLQRFGGAFGLQVDVKATGYNIKSLK